MAKDNLTQEDREWVYNAIEQLDEAIEYLEKHHPVANKSKDVVANEEIAMWIGTGEGAISEASKRRLANFKRQM